MDNLDKKYFANYSGLGEQYRKYRSGYSPNVINLILHHIMFKNQKRFTAADIGAGTGIWTRQIVEAGISKCLAIEPNEDMMTNGIAYTKNLDGILWIRGCAENTGLANSTIDWATMASSFHWTDHTKSLPEFHRILKKGGYLTLVWNPLMREGDILQEKVEEIIQRNIGRLDREFRNGEDSGKILLASGYFNNVLEIKYMHYVTMPAEKYLNAWKAANHVRKKAEALGSDVFNKIIDEITAAIDSQITLNVPYITKSWTAKKL